MHGEGAKQHQPRRVEQAAAAVAGTVSLISVSWTRTLTDLTLGLNNGRRRTDGRVVPLATSGALLYTFCVLLLALSYAGHDNESLRKERPSVTPTLLLLVIHPTSQLFRLLTEIWLIE